MRLLTGNKHKVSQGGDMATEQFKLAAGVAPPQVCERVSLSRKVVGVSHQPASG